MLDRIVKREELYSSVLSRLVQHDPTAEPPYYP
jgi:hypothetical protein